jgi:hypothetical protein
VELNHPPRNHLPSPRALLIALAIASPFFLLWLHGHNRRAQVERVAGAAASQIAGRDVSVNCPGPIRQRLFYEIHEGSVRFGPGGEPHDETNLSARTCDGLRRALDEGSSLSLSCLAYVCPPDDERAAAALAVLAHEAVHLRGVINEGRTECEARTRVAAVAAHFGIGAQDGEALARWQATDWADELPPQYQSC